MRGASGDAARRDEDRAAGPSNAAFEDYIKFEDMFGASSLFTTGTARQKQREREAYVKDVMERKLYGYVHRLETHGAPIQRVTIGGGCEAPENADGFALAAAREAATARVAAAEATPARDGRGKKRARMSAAHGGGGARAATPHRAAPRAIAPWGASPGAIPDLSVARFHANDASLANVFEATQDDWEQDSLWAAMEEAVGNPGFRGGVHGSFAEDPASILPPLSALKPAAPPQEALAAHEPAPRERFERIEERINDLETRLAAAQDAARATPSPPASADPPSNTAPGLFVHTHARPGDVACDPPASGSGGKSPQSPSPLARAPPDPSRSRSHSAEARERAENNDLSLWSPGFGFGFGLGGGDGARHESTSTPRRRRREEDGSERGGGGEGGVPSRGAVCGSGSFEPPSAVIRRLELENARLAEAKARAIREHDVLRDAVEHDRAQSALLREANARYEARVAQLECMVRAAAAAGSNRGGDHAQQALGSNPIASPLAGSRGGERGVNAIGAEGRGSAGRCDAPRGEGKDHPAGGSRAGSEERGRGAGGRPPAGDSSSPTASGVEGGRA